MADKESTPVATAVSSPAVAVAANKTAIKSTKSKTMHPSTAGMVIAAITALKERGGSSLQAIKKYITGTYMLDADRLAPFIRKYIKAAVLSGALVQTKGKGASGRFKLPAGKIESAKVKTAKKPAISKSSTSSKKSVAAKKSSAGKKPESPTKAVKKPIAPKKKWVKREIEKGFKNTKKVSSGKLALTKATKSPSKVKKVSKALTRKPKTPKLRLKTIAAPKSTAKKTVAAKK